MVENSSSFSTEKAQFATRTIESLYRFSIHNSEALAETQELLRENSGRNLLLYFNHISFPDPVFIYWLYNRVLDPNLTRQVILPASHLHTRFTYNPVFASIFALGKLAYDYQGIRLIQSYMVGNQYTQEEAIKNYRDLIETIKDPTPKREKKPLTLIIAPEGHRSDDGLSLQKGEEGMVKLAKIMAPVAMLPIGINYPDRQYDRNRLNFHHRVDLTPALPILIENRQDPGLDYSFLMHRLALVLPEDMRGYWS